MMFSIICLFYLLQNVISDTECPNVVTFMDSHKDIKNDKSSLRVVQYNVEWLYIDHYDNFDCPGSQCTWSNVSEAETHMSYVANALNNLDPDIINLCEVEGCDELNMLNEQLTLQYNPYLIFGTDTSSGQNVGMLSLIEPKTNLYRTEDKFEYPIKNSKCGFETDSTKSTGVSKHYITEFEYNNMQIAFISAHFIAIPYDPERCAKREAQASVLQKIIYNYINSNYEIVMIGDFNDYDGKILDINNNIPTSQVLEILKGNFGIYEGKYELSNIAEFMNQTERYSNWWNSDDNCNTNSSKDYSSIDHILVTTKIKSHIKNVFIYHNYSEYCGKYDSDHYPLVMDLE
jgi:exonuclease III